jgi:hypothetical protein
MQLRILKTFLRLMPLLPPLPPPPLLLLLLVVVGVIVIVTITGEEGQSEGYLFYIDLICMVNLIWPHLHQNRQFCSVFLSYIENLSLS